MTPFIWGYHDESYKIKENAIGVCSMCGRCEIYEVFSVGKPQWK